MGSNKVFFKIGSVKNTAEIGNRNVEKNIFVNVRKILIM